jgi:hypothetical protein
MRKMCLECGRVGYHHPNCPEAEDYEDNENDLPGDGEEFFSSDREWAEATNCGRG